MALSDRTQRTIERALANRTAAKELIDEIAGMGGVPGVYPADAGATTLGTADTDITTIKGILQFSAPTGISAAGTTQGTATALTSFINNVTTVGSGAGVKLTANTAGRSQIVYNGGANALKVYPSTGGAINGGSTDAAVVVPVGGYVTYTCLATNVWKGTVDSPLEGVLPGYKVARGQHTQVAASDTIVTGLATVVAVTASFDAGPTVKQLHVAAGIGDQAGTPAAGSILIKTFKPTSSTADATPTAATDFTDNLKVNWIAVGT